MADLGQAAFVVKWTKAAIDIVTRLRSRTPEAWRDHVSLPTANDFGMGNC